MYQYNVRVLKEITGWPKSKFAISNGYNFENMHFWPHVGKAKMCFGGIKNCKQTAKNCKQIANFDLGHPVCK